MYIQHLIYKETFEKYILERKPLNGASREGGYNRRQRNPLTAHILQEEKLQYIFLSPITRFQNN